MNFFDKSSSIFLFLWIRYAIVDDSSSNVSSWALSLVIGGGSTIWNFSLLWISFCFCRAANNLVSNILYFFKRSVFSFSLSLELSSIWNFSLLDGTLVNLLFCSELNMFFPLSSFYSTLQSISLIPLLFKNSFVFENGLLPKNPL